MAFKRPRSAKAVYNDQAELVCLSPVTQPEIHPRMGLLFGYDARTRVFHEPWNSYNLNTGIIRRVEIQRTNPIEPSTRSPIVYKKGKYSHIKSLHKVLNVPQTMQNMQGNYLLKAIRSLNASTKSLLTLNKKKLKNDLVVKEKYDKKLAKRLPALTDI